MSKICQRVPWHTAQWYSENVMWTHETKEEEFREEYSALFMAQKRQLSQ